MNDKTKWSAIDLEFCNSAAAQRIKLVATLHMELAVGYRRLREIKEQLKNLQP